MIDPVDNEGPDEVADFETAAAAVSSGVMVVVDVGDELEAVDTFGRISGTICPGLNINDAFFANFSWSSKFFSAVGLTTPIIPSSRHAPGAEQ